MNGRRSVPHAVLGVWLLVIASALPGCIERRIRITSTPPGALVWVNDVQVGRTPVETAFLFHGVYDVRLHLDGYEPLATSARAKAPWYEFPGVDLLASAAPVRFKNIIEWHFDLDPVAESVLPPDQAEAELLERARRLRTETEQDRPKK